MQRIILMLFLLSLALCAASDESLTGSVVVGVSHEYKSIDGGKTLRDTGAVSLSQGFSYGNSTEAAQVNGRFSAMYGLKSDTETVIETQGIYDSFADDLTFTRIKAIILKNHSLTHTVTVGSSTATVTPFDTTLPPGGAACFVAPYGGWELDTWTNLYLNTDGTASCEVSILGTQ